jgi:hypothetical protein
LKGFWIRDGQSWEIIWTVIHKHREVFKKGGPILFLCQQAPVGGIGFLVPGRFLILRSYILRDFEWLKKKI